jgi:hypothetical protein
MLIVDKIIGLQSGYGAALADPFSEIEFGY